MAKTRTQTYTERYAKSHESDSFASNQGAIASSLIPAPAKLPEFESDPSVLPGIVAFVNRCWWENRRTRRWTATIYINPGIAYAVFFVAGVICFVVPNIFLMYKNDVTTPTTNMTADKTDNTNVCVRRASSPCNSIRIE